MAEEELEIHEQKGNHILHIRGDSDSDLETLFKSVMNPSDTQMPLTVPMRLRKLPKSFFKPPETGSKTPPQPQQTPVSRSRDTGVDTAHDTVLHPGLPPSTPLQIHHPRARSSPASLQQSLIASEPPAQQHHVRQQSYDLSDNVPLPPGWASAKTLGGQRYFLNHINQTTTWEDPRKKLRNSAMNLHSTPSSTPNAPINPLPQSLNLGSLPDEWEQATTPEGEIYFINHHTKTTSWFDPRIPLQLQRTALSNAQIHSQQAIAQLATPASPEAPTTNQINTQQRQQRARIQCLQMEGERLKLRQQEIMRQLKPQQNINNVGIPNYNEMLIRQTISEGIASSPMADLPPVSTGMDPFLGGREIHSRQESSDSGIGMEANYNLVQTPEDFLNRMDENMDTVNENCNSTSDQQQISNDLCNLDIQSQDMTALESGNMDTDELEPSLQEDLTSDILNDVEALLINNRMDTMLTWL